MTFEDIEKLIAADEGETVEVKETTGQRVDACETLCAFLNKNGGTVVFGVTRKGKLTGQLMSDSTKRDLFEAFQKFEPSADITVEYVSVDATHTAVVCRVDRGNCAPYVYDGRPYKRVQSSTTVMPQEEYERMLKERGGFRSEWESQPNPELTLEDLDAEAICTTARMAVRSGRLDSSVNTEDPIGLLDHFKLRRNGILLNGAAALFGKAERIDYPQLEIKMGWFKGTNDQQFLDNAHRQGNIFKLMDEAMAFCFKHLNLSAKIGGKIERDEELEIPADALREVLVNAFAHRSYENRSLTIYLAIYEDRVEIKNPGSYPPDFDVAKLYSPPIQHSEPRNEKIARVLYLRKSIETWGRGLKRISDECARVGLPLPTTKVEYGNVVTVFQRPDWSRTGTTAPISGTECQITGTAIQISGSGWGLKYADPIAHLPRMRRDARENAEMVLHEIILDNNVTLPQICARTGMALRTINNAIATLREAGIIRSGRLQMSMSNRNGNSFETQVRVEVGVESPEVGVETPEVGVENGKVGVEVGVEKPKVGVETAEVGVEIDFDQLLSANRKAFRETCRTVWSYLADHPNSSQPEIAAALKIAVSTAQCACNALKEVGLLVREGATKNGRWIVCTGKKNVGEAAQADAKSAETANEHKDGRACRSATADGRARSPSAPQ